MSNSILTILIPTHNRGGKLNKLLYDLDQVIGSISKYRTIEVIICNNNDDSSPLVIQNIYSNLNISTIFSTSARYEIIFRLEMISRCDSEFFMFLDDDDDIIQEGFMNYLVSFYLEPRPLQIKNVLISTPNSTKVLNHSMLLGSILRMNPKSYETFKSEFYDDQELNKSLCGGDRVLLDFYNEKIELYPGVIMHMVYEFKGDNLSKYEPLPKIKERLNNLKNG